MGDTTTLYSRILKKLCGGFYLLDGPSVTTAHKLLSPFACGVRVCVQKLVTVATCFHVAVVELRQIARNGTWRAGSAAWMALMSAFTICDTLRPLGTFENPSVLSLTSVETTTHSR